jgi:hypothetical protein
MQPAENRRQALPLMRNPGQGFYDGVGAVRSRLEAGARHERRLWALRSGGVLGMDRSSH